MPNCLSALIPRTSQRSKTREQHADAESHTVGPLQSQRYSRIAVSERGGPASGTAYCTSCCMSEPLPGYEDGPGNDYGVLFDNEKGAGALSGIVADMAKDIEKTIGGLDKELRQLSLTMWENPEIAYQEHKTHDLFVKYLKGKDGWEVTPHAYGLDTAFKAEFVHRSSGLGATTDELPVIGFQSYVQMDSLPGIGHACGHNLIAISGVAASLSVAAALVKHDVPGRVVLLGTPAEEAYGGKIELLNAGAYKEMDACLMLHPAPLDSVGTMISVKHIRCTYKGQTAHAGATPWEGINAQDAGVLAYMNISALRQQIRPDCRVHGIIQGTNWAANVIPGECHLTYNTRAPTVKENEALFARVKNCLEAAAHATGCSLEIEVGSTYTDVANCTALAEAYKGVMKQRYQRNIPYLTFPASTDFGNVTYALPAMHAEYAIPLSEPARDGNHTIGFANAARTPEAHKLTLESSVGIATIGARILADKKFRNGVTEQWKRWKDGQKDGH